MERIDFTNLENLTESEKKLFIEDLTDLICDGFLDMEVYVSVSYDTSHFTTETTLAMAMVSDDVEPMIFIRPDSPLTPLTVFFIAHELRHIYKYYE